MKFDELPDKKKNKKIGKWFIIALIAIIIMVSIGALIFYVAKTLNSSKKESTVETGPVILDVNNRLVQSLYYKVHDFHSYSPYWIYSGESVNMIASLSTKAKNSLAYLNLKNSDFYEVDCNSVPKTIEGYPNFSCVNGKNAISRNDFLRAHRDLYGAASEVDTDIVIKANPVETKVYVYVSNIDSYVLYSNGKEGRTESKYDYQLTKAEKNDNFIKIYESIAYESATGTQKHITYVYTFKMEDDNLYTYYSIQSINN